MGTVARVAMDCEGRGFGELGSTPGRGQGVLMFCDVGDCRRLLTLRPRGLGASLDRLVEDRLSGLRFLDS